MLLNPNVDMAVFETARGGILREGLAFDRCDVAVVTNIGDGDHLGLSDINTPAELAKVKRCIVEAVSPEGYAVLNANDPLGGRDGRALPRRHRLLRHRPDASRDRPPSRRGRPGRLRPRRPGRAGRRATAKQSIISLDRLPLTRDGQVGFQVENALAAIAAAWSLGIPIEVIRSRAESIAADIDKVPARFNVLEIEGATVVVDYGHNTHSLAAVIEAIGKFPHQRRACVYSTAGDRRDCDIVRQGELLGAAFDRVILYEDHYLRGRAPGEIMGLLRKGLARRPPAPPRSSKSRAPRRRRKPRWLPLQPGELVLLQADTVDETIQWLRGYLAALPAKTSPDAEQVLGQPAGAAAAGQTPPGETLRPAEIPTPVLAEAHAAGKV